MDRINIAARIIEASLELREAIAKGQPEQINALSARLADLIFDADPATLEGVQACLNQIAS